MQKLFIADGSEGSTLLLQTCLDQVNGGDTLTLQLRLDLVSAVFKYLVARPNFCTIFCQALESTPTSEGFLGYLSNALNLSLDEKVSVGLALFESNNMDLRTRGRNFCNFLIEDLTANSITPVVSHERIQAIILFLYQSEGLSKHVHYFTKLFSAVPHSENSFFTKSPLLIDCGDNSLRQLDLFDEGSNDDFESVLAEIEKETSMDGIMRELGYGCTVSVSHCKEILSLFLPLHETALAKLVGTISCTHIGLDGTQNACLSFCLALDSNSSSESSLPSSWNIDVLVDSIKQIAPETNWTRVMENLDHEGFKIPDEPSFFLLMSIYSKACRDPFPLHAICGSAWKNAEGQLSFLKHAVCAPPDVFTFAHCSRQLAIADTTNLSKGSGNQAWSCLDLLDVLCQLAERGHITAVLLMLEHPLKECPEVLLDGIARVKTAYNLLQYEVISTAFPVVLNDSTKKNVVHHLWEVNANLVVRGFIDTHTNPSSLLRILDICQEMKILSLVLDATPFIVRFRLAACAYRKELTNLEKWLNENLTLFKDDFFEECVMFLKEILSDVKNDVPCNTPESPISLINVYEETCPTFFKVLQTYSGQLTSRELFNEFKRLHDLSSSKFRRSVPEDISTSNGSRDEIEAEANAYFHQMFSGLLTIDAMVQMLARFKESSEKRKQLIFDCMIANLFEEYKFFPKYPDKQLKLAAVLFGSLIKNQLVTHLALGIALRGVLDALRKSVDSKMFMFGSKALEQFIDRLVEWPQYCNHILQISHLRCSHAELVSLVERALAKISSSQTEINGGNSLLADQQQGSSQPSVESMDLSEASWHCMSSTSFSQLGQQLSPFQLQQKHQSFLGDQLKQSVISISNTNALLSNGVPSSQSSFEVPPSHSAGVPAAVSSSPGLLCPSLDITPAGMLRQPSHSMGFGAALNIETLVVAAERRDTPIEVPGSEVQDKILFMINNISTDNIEAKAKECTKAIKEQYYPWFAQYMVMKRASIEPNFHDLYLIFLDKVNSKSLNKEIVKAAYENCKVLLRSDLIKSSSEERSLLKNLGSWLGKFTIGRNEALLAKEMDLKALIIEAYEKGLMIAVIPFASKILESCQGSLAYKPPNVWTMAILALLVEIYNLPNLKMNLKFDIEVLFKNLTVDMKDVKSTLLLKDRVRIVEDNPDFSNKDICVYQASVNAEVNSAVISAMNQVESEADIDNTSRPASHPNVLAQLLRMVPVYESHISINAKLHNMSSLLQIHRFTKEALDKAIKDLVLPITQRSVAVACRTTKELVLKDNAMESDDGVISRAAHLMVGTLAGRLALVSCKEPFGVALSYHLRNLLQTLNTNVELTEQIVRLITNDNIDLGCAVIEHVASQKAVELIDSEIGPLFAAIRKRREAAGTAYCGAGTYDQGPFAHVPEALRPKPGELSVAQKRVYNDFVRNVWLNQFNESSSVVPAGPPGLGGNSVTSSMSHLYGSSSSQLNSNLYPTSEVVPGFRAARQLDLIQEASDCASPQLGISSNTVGPNDGAIHSAVEITSMMPSFASTATSPDIHTVETSAVTKDIGAVLQPSTIIPGAEQMGSASEPFLTSGDAVGKYQLLAQKLKSPTADDVRESEIQVSHMFSEWCCTCKLPTTNDTTYGHYISQLQQSGLLNGDDITDHFFHILTEVSVARCLAHENVTMAPSLPVQSSQELQHSSFVEIDAYAKLVVLVLKYFPMDQGSCKIDLLTKILSVTVRVIYKDAEEKKIFFNPRPYYRLFINWLLDLASPDPVLDGSNFQELISFASAFHALQPLKVPGFSFSWLELVSHRSFMPQLISSSPPKGWPHFQCLLVDLFKFMEPYLRNAELRQPVEFFYRGTLRVLLVLLHDFPEFLCDYHFSFCDVIPPSCTQLRNVILSAFPRNMRIPDPCTPNLKVDLLAEISQPPRILSDVDGTLIAKQIKADIDEYMKKKPEGFPFLNELNQKLLVPESEANLAGTRYNIPLINSLVLYVGMEAIRQLQNKSTPTQQMVHNAPLDIFLASEAMNIFQSLVINLDTEGRYLFINAVANQLRYPNNHTHYFSFVLLILFVEAPQEIIQEQITRVLLERLIAHRPHPWGLIITFLELIKNPRYNFWNQSFIRCAPEIEKLFESVARSCGGRGPNAVDDEMVAGGIPGSNH